MGNKLKLKVCGMREPANISEVGALRPDYMGFIFYPKSRRFVGQESIVPDSLPAGISRVGVFVDESPEVVISTGKKFKLDYVQLHGNESPLICAEMKQAGFGVIKAFAVNADFNFDEPLKYKRVVDYFLFDAKGELAGGNGITFDWSCLRRYDQEVPFFLSGGISPENIGDVRKLEGMNLHAIDVNSGVEIKPGLKSLALILDLQNKMARI